MDDTNETAELSIPQEDSKIDPTPDTFVDDELLNNLNEIDASITERHIMGKFPGEVILHGESIGKPNSSGDYQMLPEDKGNKSIRSIDSTGQFGTLNHLVRNGMLNPNPSELAKKLSTCHVISALPDETDPSQVTLQILYPDGGTEYNGKNRPILTNEVYLKMPKENFQELIKIIGKNPDALEQFYQIATNGLDNSVHRYQSSQIAVVNLARLVPADRANEIFQTANLFLTKEPPPKAITFLPYTIPHGQVTHEEVEAAEKAKKELKKEEKAAEVKPITKPVVAEPVKTTPKPTNNPSRLNEDALLTRLINSAISKFKPK